MLTASSLLVILVYGTLWSFCVYCGILALFCNLGMMTNTIKKILSTGAYFGIFSGSLAMVLTFMFERIF